jgi:hypothetical protein
MVHLKNYLTAIILLVGCVGHSFSQAQQQLGFAGQLQKDPNTRIAFSVSNTEGVLERLLKDPSVNVKSVTPEWVFIQASPAWIQQAKETGVIQQFYFEHSMPVALNDSSLVTHHVTEVHNGLGGLQTPFTGKDVIIGYVDQGLDYTHGDFIDENGDTRVLFYWDHSLPNAANTPMPYGYGQVWDAADIQAGACGSNEGTTAHGTSVAGAGSSNGLANGKQKGVAPDSKIIIVETNFNLPNWTLTIADACDFIFKKADSLGLPAVVNLSLGSYLGSHDGDDPASILMEQLLDEKPGRIVVCAAGNSGTWGKYHVHGEVDSDTSFVWFDNNPAGQLGANTVYFDLWTDEADATWSYALAANLPSGSYDERAETVYRLATMGAASAPNPIYDTLYNGANRIATIELYPEIVGGNFHLEVYFSSIDSANYKYSFKTTGSGNYDLWSGATIGLNNIVSTIPNAATYPSIIHYNLPDTLQTVVSSWNCSEKVISVGNFRNRLGHTDKNGNQYLPAASYAAVVGQLSPNSSKGPTRHGVTKPDVSACGDISLSAGPNWILTNAAYNSVVDIDGLHVRNGGTSMASPVVAGIAALYLEKCHNGTYASFKADLHATAFTDGFTGTVPNNAYGYGKANALDLLLQSNYTTTVDGPSQYCGVGVDSAFAIVASTIDSISWSNGTINTDFSVITAAGDLSYVTYNDLGCRAYSDTITLVAGDIPATPVITAAGANLSTASFPNLQWYENGVAIPGATGNTTTITLPSSSNFTVGATGSTGCEAISAPYNPSAGIADVNWLNVLVFPNPTTGILTIQADVIVVSVELFDLQGNNVLSTVPSSNQIRIDSLAKGSYFMQIRSENGIGWTKIIKN